MIPESYGIERVNIATLTAFSGNPRTHSDTQIDHIAQGDVGVGGVVGFIHQRFTHVNQPVNHLIGFSVQFRSAQQMTMQSIDVVHECFRMLQRFPRHGNS